MALLKQYNTPVHVIRHCVKVTETALKIGQALNEKGCGLDLGLIQGAGLIHDIARVEEKHWESVRKSLQNTDTIRKRKLSESICFMTVIRTRQDQRGGYHLFLPTGW
jgi:HD superfamily phosphodiesterase